MKLLLTSPHRIAIQQTKTLLEAEGVSTLIEGDDRASLAGVVPAQDCWLKLFVLDESQFDQAQAILNASTGSDVKGRWRCPTCGEFIETRFAACWRCASPSADQEQQPNVQQGVRWLVRMLSLVLIIVGALGLLVSVFAPWLVDVDALQCAGALVAGAVGYYGVSCCLVPRSPGERGTRLSR